jgi:hydrogenase maturation protease
MSMTLVLGLGNQLLGDEGVGVHAAEELLRDPLPSGVVVLDVGTAVLDALPAMEVARRIVVVDAVRADQAPGTVYRVPFDDMQRPQVIGSVHGFDLSRVLALSGRTDRPEVVVIGVEPETIDWSLELSPPVREAMPAVLEAIRAEVGVPGPEAPTRVNAPNELREVVT